MARSLGLPLGEALAPGQLKELGQSLGRCSVFLQGADRQGARAGEAFAAYLAQEGLLDGSPWVAVDSGWMGSTQESLGKILQGLGQGWTLEGCYWGLYRSPNKMPAHCWYFSPHNGWREKAWFANSLMEALLGAAHGTVLGYRQGAGRVLPVCGPEDGTRKDLFRKTEPVYQGVLPPAGGTFPPGGAAGPGTGGPGPGPQDPAPALGAAHPGGSRRLWGA